MSPRIQRLATDWKTYFALVSAGGSAITAYSGLFDKVKGAIEKWLALPPEAKWVAVALLGLLALFAAIAAWSRRSILLRPDRFIVSADDPEQLIGRKAKALWCAPALPPCSEIPLRAGSSFPCCWMPHRSHGREPCATSSRAQWPRFHRTIEPSSAQWSRSEPMTFSRRSARFPPMLRAAC